MTKRLKVDFLNPEHDKKTRRTTVIVAVIFTLFVGAFSAIGAGASYRSAAHGTNVLMEIGNLPVIADIRRLVLGNEASADNKVASEDGRVNIMLFGVGGPGHNGSELTDTIILASLDIKNDKVALLSIPRDMAYPLENARFQKINAVNAYAELEHPGQGAEIASQAIGKLFGVRIDHVIKINFQGFEKFIDALDGIDVTVEREFTDYSYPTLDDKWRTVSFKKGPQHMRGAEALIFVRSRHGNNSEGGDFARSHRQQIVLDVVREKLLSRGILANPQKIAELWGIVSSHVQTDLSPWDFVKFAQLASRFDRNNLISQVLTDEPDGELIPGTIEDAYMLFPKKPDWSEIRSIAQNPFETKEERLAKQRPAEEVLVEIKNGTTRTGFAGQASNYLTKNGYIVTGTGNALQRGYEKTVIFDLTGGTKTVELARLKKILNANVSSVIPAWLSNDKVERVVYSDGLTAEPISGSTTEFLIILGESSLGLVGI
jgi:LCP family protein required for cell wall assembly